MRKITVFNFTTLNGFFKDSKGGIEWHTHGAEEGEYGHEGLGSDSILLFGRVTYDMMAGYWPTPMATQNDAVMAEGMNKSEKIVFSRSMKSASWNNTRVISGNIFKEVADLKKTPGKDMTILGSGSIVTQFAEVGLIDTFQFMIDPVAIGGGTPVFKDIKHKLELKLTSTRAFKSGVVLVNYVPVSK